MLKNYSLRLLNMKSKKEKAIIRGSRTARGGFRNEEDVVARFNNWRVDETAQAWLSTMGYEMDKIDFVQAAKVRGHYKADVQVRIQILIKLKKQEDIQNLQVKLVSNPQGFNQIDKRWVDSYAELWSIPGDVVELLKLFTGEIESKRSGLRDSRKVFFDEMTNEEQAKIINFFTENKILIISDLLKGRGEFSADWTLVILKAAGINKWVLRSINEVMNVFGSGEVRITARGSLKIGGIGMQRKGGDGGRKTAQMLQFKINPVELFS